MLLNCLLTLKPRTGSTKTFQVDHAGVKSIPVSSHYVTETLPAPGDPGQLSLAR